MIEGLPDGKKVLLPKLRNFDVPVISYVMCLSKLDSPSCVLFSRASQFFS